MATKQEDLKFLKFLKLLIVDDDEKSLELLEAKLNIMGFKNILKADSGRECLTLAQDEAPDLIFLDVMLPDIDGGTVKSKLLEDEKTKDIPIIFSTALVSDEELKNREGTSGGALYIAKPYDTKKIAKAIHEALRNVKK